jgi:hypothetical protein
VFELLEESGSEDGSQLRYEHRKKVYNRAKVPIRIHAFWWVVHNAIAHPIIAFIPFKWAFDFHDWTSRKINLAGSGY